MFDGKSFFSWNVPAIHGGDPDKVVQVLKDNKIDAIALKCANGNLIQTVSSYSQWPTWGQNIRVELVAALKSAGIKVWFWHFNFGVDVVGERNVARFQCDKFQPDGYIWNAESAFDSKPTAVANAKYLSQELRVSHPQIPQALAWWAFPVSPTSGAQWHPLAVGQEWMKVCDVGMPMMYWGGQGAVSAVDYYNKSMTVWRSKVTAKPIVPVGRTYNGDGGFADPPGITAFAQTAFADRFTKSVPGCSWYSIDEALKVPTWMDAVKTAPSYFVPPASNLTLEEKVDILVAGHPELFAGL